jgi:hypothetical protein
MSVENTDTFGNYLIHGIDEIMLPNAVSWWPSAPGWQVLAVIALAWLIVRAIRIFRTWWRNRYRREALRQLQQLQQQADGELHKVVEQLPFYIKATALHAYPRATVASLSGDAWLAFLDAHCSDASFSAGIGKKLLTVSYLPRDQWQLDDTESKTLITMVCDWIKKHHEVTDV